MQYQTTKSKLLMHMYKHNNISMRQDRANTTGIRNHSCDDVKRYLWHGAVRCARLLTSWLPLPAAAACVKTFVGTLSVPSTIFRTFPAANGLPAPASAQALPQHRLPRCLPFG